MQQKLHEIFELSIEQIDEINETRLGEGSNE